MKPVIRPERPSDAAAIHQVTRDAFSGAPHSGHNEQFIVEALRNADALSVSLVAEIDGTIIGHVAVSPVCISDGSPAWFGLGPISVQPEFQNRGIGNLLMEQALEQLREQDAAGCVLLGEPAYYARFGFKPVPGLVLPDVPPGYFQALAFGSTLPRGVVKYHEAFNLTPQSPE